MKSTLAFAFAILSSLGEAAAPLDLALRVVSVTGTATVDKQVLHPGDSLHFGQVLEVAPKGGVKLLTVVDRSIFDISDDAVVAVGKAERVEMGGVLKMEKGHLRFSIHSRLVWGLDAQGIRYNLVQTTGAVAATIAGDMGKQKAATRDGSVEVSWHEKKIATLTQLDQITLEGKLENGLLVYNAKQGPKRSRIPPVEIREWVARNAVEDPVFVQSIALGADETLRARGITYQFLQPGPQIPTSRRAPVAFDDPEHAFTARAPLFELNGSAQLVRQQATLGH